MISSGRRSLCVTGSPIPEPLLGCVPVKLTNADKDETIPIEVDAIDNDFVVSLSSPIETLAIPVPTVANPLINPIQAKVLALFLKVKVYPEIAIPITPSIIPSVSRANSRLLNPDVREEPPPDPAGIQLPLVYSQWIPHVMQILCDVVFPHATHVLPLTTSSVPHDLHLEISEI